MPRPAHPRTRGLCRTGLMVCASGARSQDACRALAEHGIAAENPAGGTDAWAARGHDLHRPEGATRAVRGKERQVRLTAGMIVLLGLGLGVIVHPAFQLFAVACGRPVLLAAQ